MHLYLSSYRIGNQGNKLSELAGGGKAFIISNALDFSNDLERLQKGKVREISWLSELAIEAIPLDLRDFINQKNVLRKKIDNINMLWVVGGNTFLLRQAMKLSGLDKILLEKVDDESFVYGGYSAGVCVLSPSLKGIHLADKPEAKAVGYESNVIWDGIGIIDYYVVPHYRCDHWESESMEAVAEYYKAQGMPFKTIADGEVIFTETHKTE